MTEQPSDLFNAIIASVVALADRPYEEVAAEYQAAVDSHAAAIRFELDPRGGEIAGSANWIRAMARLNRRRRRMARARRYVRVSVRRARR
jgi:hypothetical protein